MDREIWRIVFAAIKRATRVIGHTGRRPIYADWLVTAMYVWCVMHDRPLCWACDRKHYGSLFRPRKLPSVSQFTRRVKSDVVQRILQHVHNELATRGIPCDLGYIDGKPLLVSPVSKDRQATRGKVCGGFAKGYKLHAFVNRRRRIVIWSVMGLNVAEQSVAAELLAHLPPLTPQALVMMDSNYDSAPLHKISDTLKNMRRITPLKGQQRVGEQGHHPVTLRQMGATRRTLVREWDQHPDLLRFVLKERDEIERTFGVLVCTAGGLANLPSWVRTLSRVRRWVGVKIILYNARIEVQERLQNRPDPPLRLEASCKIL
jgi:Transposase DDE domain